MSDVRDAYDLFSNTNLFFGGYHVYGLPVVELGLRWLSSRAHVLCKGKMIVMTMLHQYPLWEGRGSSTK